MHTSCAHTHQDTCSVRKRFFFFLLRAECVHSSVDMSEELKLSVTQSNSYTTLQIYNSTNSLHRLKVLFFKVTH